MSSHTPTTCWRTDKPLARSLATLACLALVLCTGIGNLQQARADDAEFIARVQADTKWLTDYGTRQIGTEAHARLQDDLLNRLEELDGVKVWTDAYQVLVPIDDETSLTIADGPLAGKHTMFPIWPDVARLNTTPNEGIQGKLVYVGEADARDLPADKLHGNIAVMEMSAYEHYRRAFDFGAAAVIFLESDKAGKPLPSMQSLYKPRYYVPAGPLADALRKDQAPAGRIDCKGQWKQVTARNVYVAVKPADTWYEQVKQQLRKDNPDVDDQTLEAKYQAAIAPYSVVAPYDAMSRVMGIAPGADAALDCAIVLNLLDNAISKPTRPLLFGFVDSYHINQIGIRRMSAMLSTTPDGRTRERHDYVEEYDLEEYEAAYNELQKYESIEQGLSQLHDATYVRRLLKDAVGRDLLELREIQGELRLAALRTQDETEKNAAAVRQRTLGAFKQAYNWLTSQYERELSDEDLQQLEVAHKFVQEQEAKPDLDSDAQGWAGLERAKELAEKVKTICEKPLQARNSILNATFSANAEVDPANMEIARITWNKMATRVRGQYERQKQRLNFFEPLDKLRKDIATYFQINFKPELDENGQPKTDPQTGETILTYVDRGICPFMLGIDLSDCGVLVGPGKHCAYNRMDLNYREFQRAIKRAAKAGEIWPEDSPERRVVNMVSVEGRSEAPGATGERALITVAAGSFLVSGVTWITDDAPRQVVDSPLDRYDHLSWERITPQIPATLRFVDWVMTSDQFEPEIESPADTTAEWRHGMGRIVDISAGETVPRVPRPGFLATLVGYAGDMDGIRRHEFAWTSHDGAYRIPLMCADVDRMHKALVLHAFRLNENNAFVESLTTKESMVASRLATTFNLGNSPGDQIPRAVTFQCTELNGPSFYDARFLEPLTEGTLIDAVRGGAPKQFHFSIDKTGQMWGVVEPGTQWQLAVRAGAAGVRMALLNAVENGREKGLDLRKTFQRGFSVDNRLPSIPSHISARDIFILNGWRLHDFHKAGIKSEKVDEIRDDTRETLKLVEQAAASGDGAALQRQAVRSLASEIRAYRAITQTGQDIARGAIFLMLMLVPFAIAMERLLFAFSKIGPQISGGVAIFAVMTFVLWTFHPAFRISAQPLVIVMAFTILAMAVAVISLVLARFKASMREFQSSLAEGSGAQMGRSGLLGSAVFLGIANMRKRKVRTALTGTTLVLVTFALLCFSSASSYVDKKDFRLEGVGATKPAVMIRRPTFGPITDRAAVAIDNLLGMDGVTVSARSWLVPGLAETSWQIWLHDPTTGEQAPTRGVLGLPANEDQLTSIDRVLPNWQQFAEHGGCYLSDSLAEQLGVKPGDTINVRGQALVLRGVYDPISLEDQIKMLDGQRIIPYDYSKQEKDWVDRDSQDAIEQEMASASAMQPTGDDLDLYLSAAEMIILPNDMVLDMGGELRSLAIACQSIEQAAEVAHTLSETIVYPAYYANDKGGVNVVVATPLIAVPPRNLAVPLVIAALIIFTTMLNSVSERKKEIYVYSSLGLAPMHIGALFVAEALTYGLMGAVFGYIAGQGMAAVLTELGWMQGITLNYSGTAVIKTMLLVQVVVVMAAIVPAVMAGRIASPSSEMDWKVPEPVDGEITSKLPFTVSPTAAPGLIAFIHEYLEAHRDGVLGHFDVDDVRILPRDRDDYTAGIEARIWLTPFDMGVRQKMRLTIDNPSDGVCEISVSIRHETGTPKLWWRLNRPFFYELRRQLLGWRKVTPERMQDYINRLVDVPDAQQAIGQ